MKADHDQAAGVLLEAYRTATPVRPLTERYPELDVAGAYAIQQAQLRRWLDEGRKVLGRKVGLTSRAMQRQLGVSQPDFGVLRDDMFYPEAARLPVDAFIQPRIEPEVAFVLKRGLGGPGVTVADAAAAVAFVLPALEVIDSRIADWKISIADTIADNASSGGVVLGSTPRSLDSLDLPVVGCNLYRGGVLAATGAGGAVLGSPLLAVAWLANTLGGHGSMLEEGQVVLSGSLTAAQPVLPGDSWTAHFAGLGRVTASFGARGQS